MTGNRQTKRPGNPSSSSPPPAGGVGSRAATSTRPLHPCPQCGKTFTKRSNRIIHERLHTGEMPYSCRFPGCGKKYKWLSSINFHENRCSFRTGGDPNAAAAAVAAAAAATTITTIATSHPAEATRNNEDQGQVQGEDEANGTGESNTVANDVINTDVAYAPHINNTGANDDAATATGSNGGGNFSGVGGRQHTVQPYMSEDDSPILSSQGFIRTVLDTCILPFVAPPGLPESSAPLFSLIRKRSPLKNRTGLPWNTTPVIGVDAFCESAALDVSSPVVLTQSTADICPMVAKSSVLVGTGTSRKSRKLTSREDRTGGRLGIAGLSGKTPRCRPKSFTKSRKAQKTVGSPCTEVVRGTSHQELFSLPARRTDESRRDMAASGRPLIEGQSSNPHSPESFQSASTVDLDYVFSTAMPGHEEMIHVAPHLMLALGDELDVPISPMTPDNGVSCLRMKPPENSLLDDFCLSGVELFAEQETIVPHEETDLSTCPENGLTTEDVFGIGSHGMFSIDGDLSNDDTLLFYAR